MREALGVAGAVVAGGAAIYYIVDIYRGGTRPHRVSWAVWTVVAVLGYGSAGHAGAGAGADAAGIYVVACAATLAISLLPGRGKSGGYRYDWPLGAIAIAGAFLWRYGPLSDAAAAGLAVGCDTAALWPTLRAVWRDPSSESRGAWTGDVVGCALALAAVDHYGFASTAYPAYLVINTGLISAILWLRRPATAYAARIGPTPTGG
ncbi:MAG TPA: hypothetical protein VG165_02000 [Solirubrobacteraceae bacterium]|nr:hypothetical protein [Solirubrobacteraceae bacterium]